MRSISSKDEFKTYIKNMLGDEYQCIELSDTQLENIIEMTIQKYSEFAYDGLKHRVYIQPIEIDTQDYILGDDSGEPSIFSVIGLIQESKLTSVFNYNIGADGTMFYHNLFNRSNQYRFLDYEIQGSYLEMYQKIYMKKKSWSWDEPSQTLHLFEKPTQNENVAIDLYQYHDSDVGLYNKIWVKLYATAYAQLTWGRNFQKLNGIQLPGGASVNFEFIISEAKEEITKLEEQLDEKYSAPGRFFVG
jgi:hypothetical protein